MNTEQKPDYLFVIKDGDDLVKFGHSKHPFRRLKELQKGNYRELHLIFYVIGDLAINLSTIKDIKEKFDGNKVVNSRDWFKVTPELVDETIRIIGTRLDWR